MADEPTTVEKVDEGIVPGTGPVAAPPHEPAPLYKPEVYVNKDDVPAQTTGPAADVPMFAVVHETHVVGDHVITDPHSPYAVQVPPEGRGSAMTPMGRAYGVDTAEHPEDALARKANEAN